MKTRIESFLSPDFEKKRMMNLCQGKALKMIQLNASQHSRQLEVTSTPASLSEEPGDVGKFSFDPEKI